MNKDYSIRRATINDVNFLADVVINAEKSMSDNLGLAKFFEVSEEQLRSHLISMFNEEIDGCEFFPKLNIRKIIFKWIGWVELVEYFFHFLQ